MAVFGALLVALVVAIVVGMWHRGPATAPPRKDASAAAPLLPATPDADPATAVAEAPVSLPPHPAATSDPVPVVPIATTEPELTDAVVNDPLAPSPPVAATGGSSPVFLGPAGDTANTAGNPVPSEGGGQTLFESLAKAAEGQEFSDRILEALMVAGTEHREKGNMQEAMKNLRQIESALPEHPRVLSELGATLGKMGLKDKAEGYWERVEALGAAGAGAYFPIAGGQLGRSVASKEAPPSPGTSAVSPKAMKIGEIKVEEHAPAGEGQKVSLAVVIDADPALRPLGEDLSLLVYFYDRVGGGGMVRPSTADTSYLYPTEPYDWQVGGTETIVVNYHQPPFTEEQKRELGERSFHGYVIELYYRDELQDKVAMPEDVAALRFENAPAEPGPGTGTPGAVPPLAPENALFPDPVP